MDDHRRPATSAVAVLWLAATLLSGCAATPVDRQAAVYESLGAGGARASRELLKNWNAQLGAPTGGLPGVEQLSGTEWLRYAWHAMRVGQRDAAQQAIDAAMAVDGRLVRVADALAATMRTR